MATESPHRHELFNRVAKGAKLLDQKCAGWAEEIDLEILDIGSCSQCILGQLYGSDDAGVSVIFGRAGNYQYDKQEEFGFFAPHEFDSGGDRCWDVLLEAWKAEIVKRLGA